MVRPGVQLYTLRSIDEPLPALIRRVAKTPFEGVEFAGLGETPTSPIAEALRETEMTVIGAHVGMESIETDLDSTGARYSRLGCDRLVVPRLEPEQFETEGSVRGAADRLNDLARRLDEWDLDLCYHNHAHEFAAIDGTLAFDVLVEALDNAVGLELDVGWVAAAGADPVDVLERVSGRVPLVHLKDVDSTGAPVDLGEGVVDLPGCVAAARSAGTEWLVYEHDEPADPERSLADAAETVPALIHGGR